MGTLLLLAVALNPLSAGQTAVAPNAEWEEMAIFQKLPGYHPFLRFNPQSTFVFKTQSYIAEGHYQQDGGHYTFRPETAVQLNHADVDKLVADNPPEVAAEKQDHYAKSLAVITADYNDSTGALFLACQVDGRPRTFELHSYTEGDD